MALVYQDLLAHLQDPRFAALAVVTAAAFVALIWLLFRRRVTPEERERRRRLYVNSRRRSIEGFITDANDSIVHYQYELRGVTYFASQDISAIGSLLPPDPSRLIGPVTVRLDPGNPANSIVVCEEWSGLSASNGPASTEPN